MSSDAFDLGDVKSKMEELIERNKEPEWMVRIRRRAFEAMKTMESTDPVLGTLDEFIAVAETERQLCA